MKKITLNKQEDIELTEREQEIYEQGLEDGNPEWDWSSFAMGVTAGIWLIIIITALK